MKETSPNRQYLVLSRGQWDRNASKEDINAAIHQFYGWLDEQVAAGRMKSGSRLTRERAIVSREGIVTDGPFGESKEVIGGYWFIIAPTLQEAASLAAQNPCARYGLSYEVRPLDPEQASAYTLANETPGPV
jgi:hypothetical protein